MSNRKEEFDTNFDLPNKAIVRGWDIQRAYERRELLVHVVSQHQFLVKTHWLLGRHYLHRCKECAGCAKGIEMRVAGYLLAEEVVNRRRVIVEYTENPAIIVRDHERKYGGMRGVCLVLYRKPQRPNGKVFLEVRGKMRDAADLTMDEDMWPIVCHIYGLTIDGAQPGAAFIPDDDKPASIAEETLWSIQNRRLTVPEPLPGQMSLLSGIGGLPGEANFNDHPNILNGRK